MRKNKKKGLSLIETLITMAILGIIVLGSSKVITSFSNMSIKERKTTEKNREIEGIFREVKKDAKSSESTKVSLNGQIITFIQRIEIEPKAPDYKLESKTINIKYENKNNSIIISEDNKKIDEKKGYKIKFELNNKILIITLSYEDKEKKQKEKTEILIID